MNKIHLVVIDPQKDFCDPKGSLFVPGADEDMSRLAAMVRRLSSKLADIHVTLDSHRKVDIAHPIFWKDGQGHHPNPFTVISVEDVENGRWTTTIPGMYKRALDYVKTLRENKRYALCVWPEHCLIGSEGYAIVPELFQAFQEWESRFAIVDFVTKGSNIYTEHYSAVVADVPDPDDPTTQINTEFIKVLNEADTIVIAGEALSHCVANTVRDIANNFKDASFVKKLVLLTDASSPVPGFEQLGVEFIKDMTAQGMQLSTTTEFLK